MLIYAAANQGRSSTSFIILRCECDCVSQPEDRMKLVLERTCS